MCYLEMYVLGFEGLVDMEKFVGGQLNLIFLLNVKSGCYVLCCQLLGELLKFVYVVDCEFCVLIVLLGIVVLVVYLYYLCEDCDVIGSLFYVMSFEDGWIFWDFVLFELLKVECVICYDVLLQMMVVLYDVDVDVVGFVDYGCLGNYFECQIGVWMKQYCVVEIGCFDVMEMLIDWLLKVCFEDMGWLVLVYGDFWIDNLMFVCDGYCVQVVFDWELLMFGNLFVDFVYFCMCLWLLLGGQVCGFVGQDCVVFGILDEVVIVVCYCELCGIVLICDWYFYFVFSFFWFVVIVQGVKVCVLQGNVLSEQVLCVGEMVGWLVELVVGVIDVYC